jgi:general nucleoside transport system ATP-binding protein
LARVLKLSGITKRFGAMTANDAISLELREGEILGLLGENGAGKTTLMNILFGHYVADEGEIEAFGQPLPQGQPRAALERGIGMVHQHFTLADNLSVLDNIVLGTQPFWSWRNDLTTARARVVSLGSEFGLGVDPDAVVSTLSVGERQRVEILKALYRNARILILDEPTAVLTPQEAAGLFQTLKRFTQSGLSIILISHKLNEVMAACSRVIVLRAGRNVAERAATETTVAELAELMVGRDIVSPKPAPQTLGAVAFAINNGSARRVAASLSDINLQLHGGEILGIAGVSGNGQSLLADVIAGTCRLDSGCITIAGKIAEHHTPSAMIAHGIARIPEDRHAEGLLTDMNVSENVIAESLRGAAFSRFGFIDWRKACAFAETIIHDYDVKCQGPDARVGLLSGGNMQKLILGRVLAQAPRVILANQPTRGLDVGAIAYVHQQLLAARARGAGVILISEDLDELLALSDRISVMYHGRLSEPASRSAVSVKQLGLMMAGQAAAHAA